MLSGFTAVSVNSNWEPAFIESTAGTVHKVFNFPQPRQRHVENILQLASLQSLAVYFDTDSSSIAGLSAVESIQKFSSMAGYLPFLVSRFLNLLSRFRTSVTTDTNTFSAQFRGKGE